MAAKGEERRSRILKYIRHYHQQFGYSPSVREIGAAVGLKSTATVARHLKVLESEGVLSHPLRKRRAWKVAEMGPEPLSAPIVGKITAGLPILAQHQTEEHLTFSANLFRYTPDYFLRVVGDSMEQAGILDGDIVAVRAQTSAEDGDIVVALLGDEATVKRLERNPSRVRLIPANERYQPIEDPDMAILGRVIGVMRSY